MTLRHVYFYTYLERPFAAARDVLAGDPRRWLPEPAEPREGGFEVSLDAGRTLPDRLARRHAVVFPAGSLDDAHGISAVRGLRWQAVEREDWFPVLDGDLELTDLGEGTCQLALVGTYRPPLSVVGSTADRLVGHRIAEAVVRAFVLAVADRLQHADVTPAT